MHQQGVRKSFSARKYKWDALAAFQAEFLIERLLE
jgi:hypothetical protein